MQGVLVLALSGAAGCAVLRPREAGDANRLTHTNWWNFYQRGVARLDAGDEAGALEDFERCLGLRGGATYEMPEDRWRIRTYGMHFLDGYFPHRELGIAHFRLGQADEAIPWLTKSIAQTPSGRAKTYLNRARRASLQGASLPPPAIRIDPASRSGWTRERSRTLTGSASAPGFVGSIQVNGKPIFMESAAPTLTIRERIALAAGRNEISIAVRDLLGQETRSNIVWTADWSAPRLEVHRLQQQGAQWLLEGRCLDDHGLASMTVDGSPLPNPAGPGTTRLPIRLLLPMDRAAEFAAQDHAGNRLRCLLTFAAAAGGARIAPGTQYASARTPDAGRVDAPPRAARTDSDRLPPRLRLDALPVATVYDEEYFLDGEAEDRGGLASIRVNGEEWLDPPGEGPVVRKYFSLRLALTSPTNDFTVVAADASGNETVQSIRVIHQRPDTIRDEYRLAAGFPPLLVRTGDQPADYIRHCIERELLRAPVRFSLVEREEGWDYVLREHRLSVSDLAGPAAALQVGRLVAAELLLVGTVIEEDRGLTIRVNVIDCEQGVLLATDDVYTESPQEDMAYQAAGLVLKIEQRFPILEGRVARRDGARAVIDLGARHGVWPGARFLVLPSDPAAEMGGYRPVRKVGDMPVQLRVSRAGEDSGLARILPASARSMVQEGDYVYSR
jgi:hypothetical protein